MCRHHALLVQVALDHLEVVVCRVVRERKISQHDALEGLFHAWVVEQDQTSIL